MKITGDKHDDYTIFKSFKHLDVIKDVWNLPKDIGTDIRKLLFNSQHHNKK